MSRLQTEVFQGPPEGIREARLGHNPFNGHNKSQPVGSGCDSPGTEATEIGDNRRCSGAMLAQASVSSTPPPATALEMDPAAVLEMDPPPRPPHVVRLKVCHNDRLTFWYMPTDMPWRAFATKFCKVENVDPDAVNWHANCRLVEADSARYTFMVRIDLDNTIDYLGLDPWDTIMCTKKRQHASSSAAGSSRQQQPAAAATSAEQPAAAGSAEQPAAAGSSNSETTARHPWLPLPPNPPAPKRPLRSPSADRVPKQRRSPPKARPEQKKEQEPLEPKERPRVFPGSTDGRCIVWPLEAEQIYFEMAEQLRETNMSGYTEKFDQQFVKRLQVQEGHVGLSFVPTVALRQAAVAEFLRAMGIDPTKPPAHDGRSKQYR